MAKKREEVEAVPTFEDIQKGFTLAVDQAEKRLADWRAHVELMAETVDAAQAALGRATDCARAAQGVTDSEPGGPNVTHRMRVALAEAEAALSLAKMLGKP